MAKILKPLLLMGGLALSSGCDNEGNVSDSEQPNTPVLTEVANNTRDRISEKIPQEGQSPDSANDNPDQTPETLITKENFETLVAYIEENGFVVPQDGVPCDYQFNYYDEARGHRHAMMTVRRDEQWRPSMDAPVKQISVWVESKNSADNLGGYFIHETRLELPKLNPTEEEKARIEAAYKGLLKQAREAQQK